MSQQHAHAKSHFFYSIFQRTIREHHNTSVVNKVMASYGLPAFESPAPRPNKDALHRILESVVTTNERLAGQEDRMLPTVRPTTSTSQLVMAAPRFRSAAASWQDADNPNVYDVDVPMRATNNTVDKCFSGLFSSGAHTVDLKFACPRSQSSHNF